MAFLSFPRGNLLGLATIVTNSSEAVSCYPIDSCASLPAKFASDWKVWWGFFHHAIMGESACPRRKPNFAISKSPAGLHLQGMLETGGEGRASLDAHGERRKIQLSSNNVMASCSLKRQRYRVRPYRLLRWNCADSLGKLSPLHFY